MMKVVLLGTGSPKPRPHRAGSSHLVRVGDDILLFDCGPGATVRAIQAGYDLTHIEYPLFTHHHFDHDLDYAHFVLARWDQGTEQTPALKVFGPPPTERMTRDHLSVISAITPEGRLLVAVQEEASKGPDVVRFLRRLLRHIPGNLLVVWDGAPIHRGQAVKGYLAGGGGKRIHLGRLPAYAPGLNPDEGMWNYLKRVELRNVSCPGLPHLRTELRRAKERLRHKPKVVCACFAQAGLV